MIQVNSSILIYRPIKQVFEFISTSENDFQWQYGTLESARVSPGVVGIGAFFRSIGHLMGRRLLSTFEITEFEQNRKYGYKSHSGPLDQKTLYTFEIAAGSTKVEVTTQMDATDLVGSHEAILEKQLRKQLRENLAMLKGILETQAARAGERK